jgi:hypothetical protein
MIMVWTSAHSWYCLHAGELRPRLLAVTERPGCANPLRRALVPEKLAEDVPPGILVTA